MNKDQRCDLVPITPINDSENEFEEFPDDPVLEGFDPDDRKFIAVAIAHLENRLSCKRWIASGGVSVTHSVEMV